MMLLLLWLLLVVVVSFAVRSNAEAAQAAAG